MTKVPRGSVYTTLEYKINITRARSRPGCQGQSHRHLKSNHAGPLHGVATARLRGVDDGKLYATGLHHLPHHEGTGKRQR